VIIFSAIFRILFWLLLLFNGSGIRVLVICPVDLKSAQCKNFEFAPHCFLKRKVPSLGVDLPKSKVGYPLSEANFKKAQYSNMLGLLLLKRRREDAQGTDTILGWQRMMPPAAGLLSGILTRMSCAMFP